MSQNEQSSPESRRLTAHEIFESATENARSELKRPLLGLAFSGLAGGITLGLTGMAVASVRATLGDGGWPQLVAYLIYPVGFIAVIIGRQQLFTENTLYPVVLVLDERKHLLATLRLWIVVFSSNIAGALLFAALCTYTTALKPDIKTKLLELGVTAVQGSFGHFFWSGVVGGWLLAFVAWVGSAPPPAPRAGVVVLVVSFFVWGGPFSPCVVTPLGVIGLRTGEDT